MNDGAGMVKEWVERSGNDKLLEQSEMDIDGWCHTCAVAAHFVDLLYVGWQRKLIYN